MISGAVYFSVRFCPRPGRTAILLRFFEQRDFNEGSCRHQLQFRKDAAVPDISHLRRTMWEVSLAPLVPIFQDLLLHQIGGFVEPSDGLALKVSSDFNAFAAAQVDVGGFPTH